ncbi:protein TMEPAI isoform X1 [Nothobranchius furzeri]|uniref:Prostate transmembrane protein, androgen induced 1 n=4 Tax=Nothobranchius TaxID=28779 RepID=A0A1A8URE2_NOTFU|nr:protein TMEPAI isoform X1 [Nothobranchius furzeri]KAF7207562.1 transcript variant X1 [Nothobranchius furzeri]
MSGPCGNVCEKKLQTKLSGGSKLGCGLVRTHTPRRSIRATCSRQLYSRFILLSFFCFGSSAILLFHCLCLKRSSSGSDQRNRSALEGATMQPSSGTHSHENCVQTQLCAQLEFIQILVIVVVMMVMVVVITCLLNHYRISARSLLSRHAQTRRRHLPLASDGGLWSSENPGTSSGLTEHQVYNPRPPDRAVLSYLQRDQQHNQPQPPHQPQRFQHTYASSRFQPTYPYLPQSLIDLPPTISLSDGEEPPPYQGPCTLQLRDPEQQMELNRESVRAPPNRTVFDSHPLDPSNSCQQASLQAPPPSVHPGISVLEETLNRQQKRGSRVEGSPPTYSEVIGHYYHPTSLTSSHNHRTVSSSHAAPSSLIHGLLRPLPQQQRHVDHRNARNTKEKSQKPQQV